MAPVLVYGFTSRAERIRNAFMTNPSDRLDEAKSKAARDAIAGVEPRSQRTFTPSLAVIARSSGVFHWTVDGRRLYDFTSGVLVANLGHNPKDWMQRWFDAMNWPQFDSAAPLTAYNAVTPIEVE